MKRLLPTILILGACGADPESATEVATETTALERTSVETILSGSAIELDPLMTGCYERRDLRITNDTLETVEIRSAQRATSSDSSFLAAYLRGNTAITVQPGEEASLLVETYRGQAGLTEGSVDLELSVDGQLQTQRLNINTQAEDAQPITDEFVQRQAPIADTLVVVSRSLNMRSLEAKTRQNFIDYVNILARYSEVYDLRIGFVAMDSTDGSLLPVDNAGTTWVTLTPQTDGQAIVDGLDLTPRTGAMSTGLDAASQVILQPGAIRGDAALDLYFVAPEDDVSAQSIDTFLNQFLPLRDSNHLSASMVAPDGAFGRFAAPRFEEIALRSGGLTISIFNDQWARSIEQLSFPAPWYRSRFILSKPAQESTLQVTLPSGILESVLPNGNTNWHYTPSIGSVDFAPFGVPDSAVAFSVNYTPACPGLLDARPF